MKKKILDWNEYISAAVKAVSEGVVMLKNDNSALPLCKDANVAVFGRIQLHYYKSGTGSGGMVNVSKVIGITDALIESDAVSINKELYEIYKKWDEENSFDAGEGWGGEPWSQKEMPLSDSQVKKAAEKSSDAIVIIGRTAGEEQENRIEKGSYLLSDEEEDMLSKVRTHFEKMTVLLNVGSVIDMSFVEKYRPDAVLYVWQGGMVGGTGTVDVLTCKVSPSGKLTDTIAYSVSDYPSDAYFGDTVRNFYSEDIYVGYRYFETFAKEKVMYPFGYGLSYTSFKINANAEYSDKTVTFVVNVKNTGNFSGKEVVQIYCAAPQGKLGKPARVLCGYEKTKELKPNEEQSLQISVKLADAASYDDSGVTGNKSCFVLESGEYAFYVGSDVRSAEKAFTVNIPETEVISRLEQALAPVLPFKRIKPVLSEEKFGISFEDVPLCETDENARRLADLPKETAFTGDCGIKLSDVVDGKNTLEEFIAQLSDYDLSCIIRGEGMGSPKVTAGTASAFGSVSDELKNLGIPCCCCSDGPSGMRLDCGTKAFSLPNGTMIASTFNKELITELWSCYGVEIAANKVDCILGPGMNIHRHILNGRNFEYFSEDPFLSGTMAAAELKGLKTANITGTIKHFCGNNQETGRHTVDSVISERALREIYLRGFEIAVKDGNTSAIMTTYGSVNGLWTSGSYDLVTTILRKEWGFNGFAMTDWWANISERGKDVNKTNFAAIARAQDDVYMVCSDGASNNDNTLEALQNGTLTRGELQRNAMNICRFIMSSNAMKRICGNAEEIEIIGRDDGGDAAINSEVTFSKFDGHISIDLSDVPTEKGSTYVFALDVCGKVPKACEFTITGSSDAGELSQIPVTVFSMGSVIATVTWNGTGGKPVSFTRNITFPGRFSTLRLYFAQSGLKLHSIEFRVK